MTSGEDNQHRARQWYDYLARQAEACRTPVLRRFYRTGVPEPDTPLSELPLAALDFETTGLDPHSHEILSIGLVPFNLQRIRPSAGFYHVVKPTRPLDEASIAFHRITHSQVAGAKPLGQVLEALIEQLTGQVLVVHCRQVERPFLDQAVRRLWREQCMMPLIDTMAIEARWVREGWRQRLKHWFGARPDSVRLADSRRRYGLPDYSAHHAKVDAMATAELFLAQVARHYSPDTPVGQLWD
jgi:DNA polymerase-3 subunit epsilon